MTETTFWPSEAQSPGSRAPTVRTRRKNGYARGGIGFLTKPYSDRVRRFPEAGGGLFSTTHDILRYGLMLANDGELDGRRYLSHSRHGGIAEGTNRNDQGQLQPGYHLRNGMFGHDGAYGTDLSVNPTTEWWPSSWCNAPAPTNGPPAICSSKQRQTFSRNRPLIGLQLRTSVGALAQRAFMVPSSSFGTHLPASRAEGGSLQGGRGRARQPQLRRTWSRPRVRAVARPYPGRGTSCNPRLNVFSTNSVACIEILPSSFSKYSVRLWMNLHALSPTDAEERTVKKQ
jgi:hypothetical protein